MEIWSNKNKRHCIALKLFFFSSWNLTVAIMHWLDLYFLLISMHFPLKSLFVFPNFNMVAVFFEKFTRVTWLSDRKNDDTIRLLKMLFDGLLNCSVNENVYYMKNKHFEFWRQCGYKKNFNSIKKLILQKIIFENMIFLRNESHLALLFKVLQ